MGWDSWRGMNLRRAREASRVVHRLAVFLVAAGALIGLDGRAAGAAADESTRAGPSQAPQLVEASVAHGPQRPATVPVLPGWFVGKQVFYGPLVGRPKPGEGYQPAEGDSFAIHNGPGIFHFTLTSGMWWLRVGDRPRLAMDLQSGAGAYAKPGLLPDLGVSARFRAAVTMDDKTKWFDEFGSIDAVLSPGSARWTCRDDALGVTIAIHVRPLVGPWGFATEAEVTASPARMRQNR